MEYKFYKVKNFSFLKMNECVIKYKQHSERECPRINLIINTYMQYGTLLFFFFLTGAIWYFTISLKYRNKNIAGQKPIESDFTEAILFVYLNKCCLFSI